MKKRILVISNNVLSTTNNNGKTLLSLLKNIQDSEIFQIYFSNENPTVPNVSYYRISDRDAVNHFITNKESFGKIKSVNAEREQQTKKRKKHSNLTRLIREIIWKKILKNKTLIQYVREINPTHVLLLGGDFCFTYNFFNQVRKNNPKAKYILYITDEYSEYQNIGFFEFIRKKLIRKTFKNTIPLVDYFFTISDNMRLKYLNEYKKDSKIVFNIDFFNCSQWEIKKRENKIESFLYAGSLYYGREEALVKFAEQASLNRKIVINIFSNDKITSFKGKKLIKQGIINWHKAVNKELLERQYLLTDALLYVESFRRHNEKKIRYSFSTKIFEYISLNKPIFLYGPLSVNSIYCLKNCSFYCREKFDNNIFDFVLVEECINKINSYKREILDRLCNKDRIINDFAEAFD